VLTYHGYIKHFLGAILCASLLVSAIAVRAATPALPQTMILNGLVHSSKAVATRKNDTVIAYNSSLGNSEITRSKLEDNQGTYSLTITLGIENRENNIIFTYTQASTGNVYELVDSSADNANGASVPFIGGGFPFPNVVTFDMYIGRLISSGSAQDTGTSSSSSATSGSTGAGSTAGTADQTANPDVNRDGKVDTDDVFIVNRVRFGFKHNLSESAIKNADVNGDGSVTMADLILIMRH